ncbi:MAG: hydrogenase 3 maturation endopeptidase HyCI [Endomicrobiia bacterium]
MQLKEIFNGKVLLVGVGNTLKGDDSIGPVFITRCLLKNVKCGLLNAGISPENFINKIVNSDFDTVVFVDSVEMNEPPGTFKIFSPEEISNNSISTHNTSFKIFFEYISLQRPKMKLWLIGIQPKSLNFGEEISKEVNESINKLVEEIKELCTN